jgi:hypothetical protein
VVVTMRDKAKAFADLLGTNPALLQIATEYGFRTANSASLVEASVKAGLAIKPRIVDVVDPPSYEMMSEMIDVITAELKN